MVSQSTYSKGNNELVYVENFNEAIGLASIKDLGIVSEDEETTASTSCFGLLILEILNKMGDKPQTFLL